MENSFIHQTAKDYDMSIHEVERIAKLYPETFYKELEIFIKKRAITANNTYTPTFDLSHK